MNKKIDREMEQTLLENNLYVGDCIELSKKLKQNSLDLIITSPPYADTVEYGEKVKNLKEDDYVKWITNLFDVLYEKSTNSCSFILNINDKINNKLRSTYVYELIISIIKNTKWKLFDRYIWFKKATLPNTYKKRLNDRIEYIFHFVKSADDFKCNMDNVRVPYAKTTLNRFKNKVHGNDKVLKNGKTLLTTKEFSTPNKIGTKPITVFNFNTCSSLRGINHPAPFNPELPDFFIKWLSDKNDVIFDPFIGSGSTALAAIRNCRKYIGFDINFTYVKEAVERIKNEKERLEKILYE